ncbi:MAG TPA: hypothetical protein VFN91_10290 [Myxococcaceae bacterium]|nr:hypothetical protein [Myxococcaceae bacterium]
MSGRRARPVLAFTLLLAPCALAYRPFDQTDADVAELHVMELELGPLQFQRSGGRTGYVPSFIFNYGAIFGWELVVEADASGTIAGPREPGEVFQLESSVSFKGLVRRGSLQGGSGVSIAVEPEVLLPATAGASGFGFAAGVIVSQRWPALAVHLNLVPTWSRAHNIAGRVGFIAEGPDEWTVRPVGEVYVEAEHAVRGVTSSFLGGLIWRISPRVSTDAAVRAGTVSGVGLVELRVGLTWDVPL